MPKPTRKRVSGKPHPDFPLFRHATGRWCKKVKGKFAYFGKVADDPDGQVALALWLEQKDDLLAGRTPGVKFEGPTLRALLNTYLTSKRHPRHHRPVPHAGVQRVPVVRIERRGV